MSAGSVIHSEGLAKRYRRGLAVDPGLRHALEKFVRSPLSVNEASCCGCPVAASDRVGAATDLIAPVSPDLIFPCGNVRALTELLRRVLSDPVALATRGQQALRRMGAWSIRENIDGVLRAVDLALSRAKAKVGVR